LRPAKTPGHFPGSPCWSLIAILLFALAAVSVGSASPANSSSESENRSLSGTIPTSQALQLTVRADCGDVRIFTDAANTVSYSVRLDSATAAKDPAVLADFSLIAHQTPQGVELISRALNETACRHHLIYEIHVPRRYSLYVAIQSGAITAQNIEGRVAFVTGGGDIRLGSVEGADPAAPAPRNSIFAARLETAGGNISAGDIAGGLRATTGGGQISAADVHGPAVLRTGGGEIRVGHVFGAARFSTGGGNISANKIDGGVWAETDGGIMEIGNVRESAAFAPEFPRSNENAPAMPVLHARSENAAVLPFSDREDMGRLVRLFDALFWGGIRVDSVEQQKHLVASVLPAYPEVARLAGIEGDVTLRILIGQDGMVRDLRPIFGPPVLARAAMRAVEQWRYAPALVDGHPVDVVTSVTFAFHLH
jgi:TonB family protein